MISSEKSKMKRQEKMFINIDDIYYYYIIIMSVIFKLKIVLCLVNQKKQRLISSNVMCFTWKDFYPDRFAPFMPIKANTKWIRKKIFRSDQDCHQLWNKTTNQKHSTIEVFTKNRKRPINIMFISFQIGFQSLKLFIIPSFPHSIFILMKG